MTETIFTKLGPDLNPEKPTHQLKAVALQIIRAYFSKKNHLLDGRWF
jgi:hypothetical protein